MTGEEREQIIERVRARFAALRGVSLADELIAERRREAACEEAELPDQKPADTQDAQNEQ